jgi:hypothetical protein
MEKIKKNTLPGKHSFSDFRCFGPSAVRDTEFTGTKMADLGCFNQSGSDNNKYYFACICQSKVNSQYYVYTEFGRTGESRPGGFQFIEASSENEAEKIYIKSCDSKNTKRGIWQDHTTLGKIFVTKPKKDLYLVRQLNSRNTQLPDANNISNMGAVAVVNTSGDILDDQTQKLFADLGAGTTDYTRSSTVGNIIPSKAAIDEVRLLLDSATVLTNKLLETEYTTNKELKEISTLVYGRIPKKKHRSSTDWILTPEQIRLWQADLDTYESSLDSGVYEHNTNLSALNLLKFKWVNPKNALGGWIYDWWPTATANKHTYLGKLKIKNLWYFERIGDTEKLERYQKSIGNISNQYSPKFQPERKDKINYELYKNTCTSSLFHGTRSVNVAPIIKEGFRLPKELSGVSIQGALYGSGIYTASDIKKSVGYTSYQGSYWSKGSGGLKNRGAFMFICDCVLGKMYRCKYGHTSGPPSGYHSVFAEAGYSGVANDEHILFTKEAIKLRYLVEFE